MNPFGYPQTTFNNVGALISISNDGGQSKAKKCQTLFLYDLRHISSGFAFKQRGAGRPRGGCGSAGESKFKTCLERRRLKDTPRQLDEEQQEKPDGKMQDSSVLTQ
jgi:hypothetical protein